MENLTRKEIKTLVKAARDNLGDVIEEEAVKNIDGAKPLKIDVQIEIGVDDPPADKYQELRQCYYICYIIGGTRYCFRYCF